MKKISYFIAEDHSLTSIGIKQIFSDFEMGGGDSFLCRGSASSKNETLEKFNALSEQSLLPDILILDLFLNGESGLELLKEVGEKYPLVKSVVYSMYSNAGTASLALEYGAKAYVSKTSDEKELVLAAKKVLEGETYVQPSLVAGLVVYQNILESLTKQERQVLKKVIEHKDSRKIAEELLISQRTVENYLSRIYEKTGCLDHKDLVKKFG